MNLPRFALTHRSVVLAGVAVLSASGIYNFSTMSRREDPEITIRDALVVTAWPGAPAEKLDELVTDPLEKVIGEVAEVETIESKSMTSVSIIHVTVEDSVVDTDQIWDDVRAKVVPVGERLPDGCGTPQVDSDFGDVYAVCFALYQVPSGEHDVVYDPRRLEVLAELVEDELELLPSVGRVDLWGVQRERIYVEVDSADWARIGLTAVELRDAFAARNVVDPGGELDTERARFAVMPTGEFSSVAQMDDLMVARRGGRLPVRLADLPIAVDRRYEEPPRSLTRLTRPGTGHRPCIVLGVSMKSGDNVVALGAALDAAVERLRVDRLPPDLALERVNDLPRQVDTRITTFRDNVLQGIGVVLLLSLFAMGWRPAIIMATAVPLSMICAIAIVRPLGIELEQFSVASLIIALGMVVDNAIVVSDNTFRLIRAGVPRVEAAVRGAQALAVPIFTSTLTTVCAFLPMLGISGNVGEYVRSLPIVVAATLSSSFVVALLVTPIMCGWLLKAPARAPAAARTPEREGFYGRVVGWCLGHKAVVLGSATLAFAASLLLVPAIGSQFFPAGLRDQFFIKVWLPEGSPIAATTGVCQRVEEELLTASPGEDGVDRLVNAVTFVGNGGPRIMLTQEPEYVHPYFAFLIVNTSSADLTEDYALDVERAVRRIPGARISVERFMLGPPIRDPVAFRLSGPDTQLLRAEGRAMVAAFKRADGTSGSYSDWGANGYEAELRIDPYAANLAGVTNADVALAVKSLLSGAELTTYREGDHLVPVMLRTVRERRRDLNTLSGIFVNGASGKVPLNAVASVVPTWRPAVIARRNGVPTITIGSRAAGGMLPNEVATGVRPRLEQRLASLPPGYWLEQGGEEEETEKAQAKVVRAILVAVLLIALVLIGQYNSFLKPLVILCTVPMALIGVLLGLYMTGWALGFMAMLGILSMIGIVINNAIVLIDFIETKVAEGEDLRTAVTRAGRLRMRPILLTTLTTIGGLLPLSLFGGPLWAPMTNGMIFGLLLSTVLTLVVVPTLYVAFAERLRMKVV